MEPSFTLEAFHNRSLPRGSDVVRAILRVRAGEAGPGPGPVPGPVPGPTESVADHDRAEVLVIDVSISMEDDLPAAREAAAATVASFGDGMAFAIVAGNHRARTVWPADGRSLAVASPSERAAARSAIAGLTADGSTRISAWLWHTRALLDGHPAPFRHVVLLTDGRNQDDGPDELARAAGACRGVFRCDCRGLRDDWDVDEMRSVALALQGRCDIVPAATMLADELRAMAAASRACTVPDLRLRLRTPKQAHIRSCEEVHPEIAPLHDGAAGAEAAGGPVPDLLLGAWAPGEQRDYRVEVAVLPRKDDATVQAMRAALVTGDGVELTRTALTVTWTDVDESAVLLDPVVAHYDDQTELADAVAEGLRVLGQGDTAAAERLLGRAAVLSQQHNSETWTILARFVDMSSGQPRLRPHSHRLDRMVLQSRHSRTVSILLPDDGDGDDDGDGTSP